MPVEQLVTLQQLKYFVEVVNQGSIMGAAAVLYRSQPSLSASMKDLEARLGKELFIRSARGISLTSDGIEFLGYARQVVEQAELLERRFGSGAPSKRQLAVSAQHYAFAVNAFVDMVRDAGSSEYEFTLRETRTHDLIEDVRTMRSELGILYRNDFNRRVVDKLLRDAGLAFHPLFMAKPHVFVGRGNPLAGRSAVTLDDLRPFPRLSFDQGEHNSFHLSEEILSTESAPKSIRVSDRATIFNLMIGLDGYTISTGIVSEDLNGPDIVSVPLRVEERIEIGWIAHASIQLTQQAVGYLDSLRSVVADYGVDLIEGGAEEAGKTGPRRP
ncbi:LysR family transcriptional regulator [Gulosibacter sp. 10]|uniref:LysR family transcriptional regulator n=1 Tax=Gulosibacter sp. 10 TaxID=1255570 RepID=UPI00097F3BEE|nr:LysR family transcriptional regulator [Gulosibacter sp. 10]SJM51486.1 Methionine biosynthesis and transport regulator MtaR, LysR family [Gulosibacter sp. 10]